MTRTFKLTIVTFALATLTFAVLVNCSSEEKPKKKSNVVTDIVDSLAVAVAETVVTPMLTRKSVAVDSAATAEENLQEDSNLIRHIEDMLVVQPRLFAAFDGGLIIYNFDTKTRNIVMVDDKLEAIELHEGIIYVGGEYLYEIQDDELVRVKEEYPGGITSLQSHDYRLIVGTEAGLYARGIFGHEALYEDIAVTALTSDGDGLWVGNRGQGLYRWDGDTFKQRYLLRDETLFDTVYALDYSRDHLYMGTSNGFHVFDGGRWLTLTEKEGLPDNAVRTIDATGWVVYIGTDEGVVSYFKEEFLPVKKLSDRAVTSFARYDRKVLAGTDHEGILVKSGRVVRTLVDPVIDTNIDILSLLR